MEFDGELLDRALAAAGEVPQARGLDYELVVVGGSALLLGVGVRTTRDLDVLAVVEEGRFVRADPLPPLLLEVVRDVGATFSLDPDWINPGPTSLLEFGLPEGFQERLVTRRYGALTVHVAGRRDQIFFKLYASAVMRPASKHTADLIRLAPSEEELLDAARWTLTHDPSSGYRRILVQALSHLGVEDGDSKLK